MSTILMILAIVLLLLEAIGVQLFGKVKSGWLGLALWALAVIV